MVRWHFGSTPHPAMAKRISRKCLAFHPPRFKLKLTASCFHFRRSKPNQYHEKLRPGQAQMIFASFSPGGLFLAAGSADHHVRVYLMSEEGPKRILETEAHSDTVDSIQWAHTGLRFISGSKDGSAHVWHFESQQWKSLRLQMSEHLPGCPPPVDENKKLKVTMVGWDLSDKLVVTAVNDFTVSTFRFRGFEIHIRSFMCNLFIDQSVACRYGEIASRDARTHRRTVRAGIASEGSAHNVIGRP